MSYPLISVIIPVFNSRPFLRKCLNSIINQTYKNLEIILIDDNSTDGSLKISRKFKQKDSRIVLIEKTENEGVEKLRIDGIKLAKGEFIFFIDSDDWLNNDNVLKSLYDLALETNADYIQTGTKKVLDRFGIISQNWNFYTTGIINEKELNNKYYGSFFGEESLNMNCWGKLYKASLLKSFNIKSCGYSYQEDLMFNLQLFPYLKKIYICEEIGYCYRWGGMTKKYNPQKFLDVKRQSIEKFDILKQNKRFQYIVTLFNDITEKLKKETIDRIKLKDTKNEDILDFLNQEFNDNFYAELYSSVNLITLKPFQSFIIDKKEKDFLNYCLEEAKKNYYREKILNFFQRTINKI